MKSCSAVASGLFAWLLLMPPFSVTPAGKTFVDTGAPLYSWETFSSHPNDTECLKRRDKLRDELEKAASSVQPLKKNPGKGSDKDSDKSQTAFATLRERAGAARCVSSTDQRMRAPAAQPAGK